MDQAGRTAEWSPSIGPGISHRIAARGIPGGQLLHLHTRPRQAVRSECSVGIAYAPAIRQARCARTCSIRRTEQLEGEPIPAYSNRSCSGATVNLSASLPRNLTLVSLVRLYWRS